MTLSIRPANPDRPDFAGEVAGIDLTRPIARDEVAAIEAGMDRYAVLVFHDQRIDDEQQLAFTRNFGPLEMATGDFEQKNRRLSMAVNDISNIDRDSKLLARDDRTRLFSLGNMLWHSDSSFKATPAKYSLLSARAIPSSPGGNTEFADMRAAWDTLDGAAMVQQFSPARIDRDDVWALIPRIVARHEPEFDTGGREGRFRTRLRVRFRDGSEIEVARTGSRAVQQPQSNAEIVDKFRTLTDGLITRDRQAAIEHAIAGLEGLADVETLTRLLAPPVGAAF